jgi:NEDD8-activating enzyme E1 regulatory subunit
LDDKITDGEDAGVSFFLEESSIGRSRGEQACLLINEMNPDVSGEFVHQV